MELKRRGVNHVTFSLDGPDEEHDRSRHQAGLYQRILRGLGLVQQIGLSPRLSLLVRPEWTEEKRVAFLAEAASLLYKIDPQTPPIKRALRLLLDPTNSVSSFIDIGNGARDEKIQFPILDERDHALYCRNFYRLSPSLTVKANGEFATCRLAQAGEGYGNIHRSPVVDIINHFEESFVYKLHTERKLEEYLPLVDRSLFGSAFTHLCSLRSIVTLLARKMYEQQITPDDKTGVQRINREVALLTGHLKKHE
jgi:MoaA/NifB/PqqE/SkfB family radical SAM enzyme